MTPSSSHIAVIGAGVAGLFTAWYLMRSGASVTVFDKGQPGQGCTSKAAGMLAPINELEFQELELLHAGLASRKLYDEVEQLLGPIGLVRTGTIETGLTADDSGYLKRLFEFQVEQQLPVEWLTGAQLREREPFLSAGLQAGIWSPQDVQVDQLLLVDKLVADLRARGCVFQLLTEVLSAESINGQMEVKWGGGSLRCDKVVFATGVQQGGRLPFRVYPVRGEMISLQPPASPFLTHTVRIRSKVLGPAYIVPKADRILIGSTSEEKGFESLNTAGGLLDILRKVYAAVPGLYELPVKETWSGLRPATLSRMPVIDREGQHNIYHVNGLFRHGILLGPLAGKAAAELILHGIRMKEIESFRMPASF